MPVAIVMSMQVLARECSTAHQKEWIVRHDEEWFPKGIEECRHEWLPKDMDPSSYPQPPAFWEEKLHAVQDEARHLNHDSKVEQTAWQAPFPGAYILVHVQNMHSRSILQHRLASKQTNPMVLCVVFSFVFGR